MRRLLSIFLLASLFGCTAVIDKVTDVSQEAGYRDIIGKEFRVLQEKIIFKTRKTDKEIHLDEPGKTMLPRKEEIPETLPFDYHGVYVLGILPMGSTFRVEKVIYRQSVEQSYVRYKAIITSSGPFQGIEVDPTWLAETVTYPNVPKFDPKYVEQISYPKTAN